MGRPTAQEIKEARQDSPSQKEAQDKAYMESLRVTEPAPKPAPVIKKAKGGTASSRADGIASRGKTRGTMVMCGGGMSRK